MELFALLGVAALMLWPLDRLLRYCESRGWIYYRKGRGSWGDLGSAMMEIHNIYDPGRRHVLETERESEWKREEDDDGAPPCLRRGDAIAKEDPTKPRNRTTPREGGARPPLYRG